MRERINPASIFASLKKRKIVQWAVGYSAVGWATLEVFSTLQEGFGWPRTLFPFLVATLVLGLLLTIVVAWYHGEKGAQHVSGWESVIIVSLLVLYGATISWVWSDLDSERSVLEIAVTDSSPVNPSPASIAVLPFDDLSAEGDQQYFVEGLSEEIIHALAQVQDLKVAARTSTFRLVENGADINRLASDLGVAHVLEGSVRKSGNQFRITAQLIEADSGFHIWSDIFDRTSEDIFGVQNDISIAVASRLKDTIIGITRLDLARQSTISIEAYEQYLQGRFFYNRNTVESLLSAIAAFERAIALDTNYAEAHAGLSETYSQLELYSTAQIGLPTAPTTQARLDPREVAAQGMASAQRAVELAPNSGMAHTSLGRALLKRGGWSDAENEFELALELSPGYASAHSGYGLLKLYTGNPGEALRHLRQAKELDPVSQSIAVGLGMALHGNGNTEEAITELQAGTRLDPDWHPGWTFLSIVLSEAGRYDEAFEAMTRRTELQGMSLDATEEAIEDMRTRFEAIRLYKETGEPQEFQQSLAGAFDLLALSYHRAASGRLNSALFVFGALVLAGVYESAAALHVLFLDNLLGDDPRYQALLEQAGISGA